MIRFKMLHQIDICLCSIMACPNSFFGNMILNSYSFYCFSTNFLKKMNIFFYGNFAQLFSIGYHILYTLPIAFKASVTVITKKWCMMPSQRPLYSQKLCGSKVICFSRINSVKYLINSEMDHSQVKIGSFYFLQPARI